MWDVFIAYPAADRAAARALYDELAKHVRVFLDCATIRAGDNWDDAIKTAALHSHVTLILASTNGAKAYYTHTETILAIHQSRKSPGSTRIIPIVLSGSIEDLPYGLERKQALDFSTLGARGVASEVLGVLYNDRVGSLKNEPLIAQPSYPDSHIRALGEALQRSRERLSKLRRTGQASQEVIADAELELTRLRRELRTGGQLRPGDVLSERYLLLQKIGRGGMATVWLALDEQVNQKVAVKVLHGELSSDGVVAERFVRGAKAMQALRHANICEVLATNGIDDGYEVQEGERQGGYQYYVMEYVVGGDLRRVVLERQLNTQETVDIILAIGEALTFAHQASCIHRDVKPSNILLTAGGVPKLTDFDLSLSMYGGVPSLLSGLGSFIYAAPEQQHAAQGADVRADVYSLGMTAVFALHGSELPLEVVKNCSAVIEELHVSEETKNILRRAVAWQPEERYESIEVFCRELKSARHSPLDAAVNVRRGRSILVPIIDADLVCVPAGRFDMGHESTAECRPVHSVSLAEYWIGRFPITNAQYRLFLESSQYAEPALWGDPRFNQPTQPVIGVSFGDALAFCGWLTLQLEEREIAWAGQGRSLSLPTEAEWEFAARGPMGRTFPWGYSRPTPRLANFGGVIGAPTSVGNYPEGASWVDAQDVAGNVWEWCEDNWHADYHGAPQDGTAWLTEAESRRVVRGGSFLFEERGLTTYYRYWWHADKRQGNQGFRIVMRGGCEGGIA